METKSVRTAEDGTWFGICQKGLSSPFQGAWVSVLELDVIWNQGSPFSWWCIRKVQATTVRRFPSGYEPRLAVPWLQCFSVWLTPPKPRWDRTVGSAHSFHLRYRILVIWSAFGYNTEYVRPVGAWEPRWLTEVWKYARCMLVADWFRTIKNCSP